MTSRGVVVPCKAASGTFEYAEGFHARKRLLGSLVSSVAHAESKPPA